MQLACRTPNKNDMAACLQRLQHEAATTKERAAETCAENAKTIQELKREEEEQEHINLKMEQLTGNEKLY